MEGAPFLPAPLRHFQAADRRIVVLGVGNELNGDDAAGVWVVRRLGEILKTARAADRSAGEGAPAVLLLDCGPAPENFTGAVRRHAPNLVLVVDAVDLGAAPGAVVWIDWRTAEGLGASTHTLSLAVLADYLVRELGCDLWIAGIQPQHLDFDRQVSDAVQGAVQQLSSELADWLAR